MLKIHQFKILFAPRKSKRYAKVFIFPDRESMYKFYQLQTQKTGQDKEGKAMDCNFRAMFQPFEIIDFKSGKGVTKNHTGNFLFTKNRLGAGVVAHECGHASLHWYEIHNNHKNITSMKKEEELLLTLYELVRQFWVKFYKIKKV